MIRKADDDNRMERGGDCTDVGLHSLFLVNCLTWFSCLCLG